MKQTHSSSSISKVRSAIILIIPIASLVPFPLLNPNWSSPSVSSIFLSILLLSIFAIIFGSLRYTRKIHNSRPLEICVMSLGRGLPTFRRLFMSSSQQTLLLYCLSCNTEALCPFETSEINPEVMQVESSAATLWELQVYPTLSTYLLIYSR
jgi:hypothetical protein